VERWTFNMIAGPDGREHALRMYLRAGDDPAAYPCLQVLLDGTVVPVDDAAVDYEAPEWKAVQLFTAGGGSQEEWDDLKEQLRTQA
jgi:hypothetical protein